MHERHRKALCAVLFAAATSAVEAGDLTFDSAVGGAVGGAIGGAVGAELGGRDGAILGAGVGAAAGTALNTREYADGRRYSRGDDYPRQFYYERDRHHHDHGPSFGRFCPPGQAKKGRC
ncbi:MAG: hypothetical protein AB7Q81_10990 [Gammaproteobacteria bacterium]